MTYSYKGNFPQGESVVGKLTNNAGSRRGGSEMNLVFSSTLRATYLGRVLSNAGKDRQAASTAIMVRSMQIPCEV